MDLYVRSACIYKMASLQEGSRKCRKRPKVMLMEILFLLHYTIPTPTQGQLNNNNNANNNNNNNNQL